MRWRFQLTFFIFVGCFAIIVARLFYWQVVKADELSEQGRLQYGKSMLIEPDRGEIRTSDGFPIATNRVSYLAFANPKVIGNKEAIANTLAPLLSVDSASIAAKLSYDKFWIPLAHYVDTPTKQKIESLKLPGIGFSDQPKRYYPEASMAAHLLGFVGRDELGAPKGFFGLEGFYDRQLRGKPGEAMEIHDAYGRPILARANDTSQSMDGRSLNLNIDRFVQYVVEKNLKIGMEKFGAVSGMVAVMDPRTGAVLAMANQPAFDPTTYSEFDDSLYRNPFISDAYEPGSTFKALVMAAALDAGVVKPETKCTICAGPVSIGGYEIRTWNNKYEPDENMIDVIRHSDNTGMVFVGQKLGLDRLLSYIEKFGIGNPTGIDLQGEVAPSLKSSDQWYPIDAATITFGQGISITPMQLLTGFSALANDGVMMEPHVVASIEMPDGSKITIPKKVVSRPVSSQASKVMTEILVNAVNKGEAQFAKVKGYRIAGKTGTAQIPIEGHYDPDHTIASFIGFAPADDPKFAMLVIYNRPSSSIYGAETAAPTFFAIARDLLSYYGVMPTENEK